MRLPLQFPRGRGEGEVTNELVKVTLRVTREQALLIWLNIDGWLDAGACEGGLTADERDALFLASDAFMKASRRTPTPERKSDE